jgi:hypothetical protein
MRLLLTLALACRRRERDRGRLVAVELHGQLRRHDVHARSGCGRFARVHVILALRHCGALQTLVYLRATAAATCRGTVPRATTSTAARRGLSSAGHCPRRSAAWRAGRRSQDCAPARRPAALAAAATLPRLSAPGLVLHEPPTHAARRVFAGYPGLVGSVPPAISALTALTVLCAPFARPGSPPTRRLRCRVSAAAARGWSIFGAAACLRCARSGNWMRTASPARSWRASRRSPGWSSCTPRHRPCGLPADSGVLNGHAAPQVLGRKPLLRQRAADDLRADRAHALVRPHARPRSRRCGAYCAARAHGGA